MQFHRPAIHDNLKLHSLDPFSDLVREKAALKSQQMRSHQLLRSWDPAIRGILWKYANAKWPKEHWLGFIPISATRVRRTIERNKFTWWVEHDIPPYDRYRCAAYFVCLEIEDAMNFFAITIWSGTNRYFVESPTLEGIEHVLIEAAQDPPVVIPRRMGKAMD